MTLAQLILDDMQDVFLNTNDFAEAVTYRPDNGPAVSISIVWLDEEIDEEESERSTYQERRRRGLIDSDAAAGVAAPAIGGRLESAAGRMYQIERITSSPGGHLLTTRKITDVELAGQNYRARRG